MSSSTCFFSFCPLGLVLTWDVYRSPVRSGDLGGSKRVSWLFHRAPSSKSLSPLLVVSPRLLLVYCFVWESLVVSRSCFSFPLFVVSLDLVSWFLVSCFLFVSASFVTFLVRLV